MHAPFFQFLIFFLTHLVYPFLTLLFILSFLPPPPQTKLTSLYQTACEESERKVEELAKGLDQLRAVVEEVEGERDSYRDAVGELEAR